MPIVSVRELAQSTSRILAQVQESGRPAIVTKNGRPYASLVPINETDLEDFVLANAPEFVEDRRRADEEFAAGRTRSLDDVVADLDLPD